MSDWPQYRSKKTARAAKIVGFDTRDTGGRVGALVDPGDGNLEPFVPTNPALLNTAAIGGWAIRFDDGYKMVVSAAWEDDYERIEE